MRRRTAGNPGMLDRSAVRTKRGVKSGARRVQKHKGVAKPLMVALSTIMIDELGAGPARGS